MAPLSWRHHTLLQALLHRGPLSERDFHAVFAGVSGKDPGTPSVCFARSSRRLYVSSLYAGRQSPTSARRNAPPLLMGSDQSRATEVHAAAAAPGPGGWSLRCKLS